MNIHNIKNIHGAKKKNCKRYIKKINQMGTV